MIGCVAIGRAHFRCSRLARSRGGFRNYRWFWYLLSAFRKWFWFFFHEEKWESSRKSFFQKLCVLSSTAFSRKSFWNLEPMAVPRWIINSTSTSRLEMKLLTREVFTQSQKKCWNLQKFYPDCDRIESLRDRDFICTWNRELDRRSWIEFWFCVTLICLFVLLFSM